MGYTIALFGEAEKGRYQFPYFCSTLPELIDHLGHPPAYSRGLYYAIQTLLYQQDLIFFRVREEGFSLQDYFEGLLVLRGFRSAEKPGAICVPGVGNDEIIQAISSFCLLNHAIMVITEADLYDYLTVAA